MFGLHVVFFCFFLNHFSLGFRIVKLALSEQVLGSHSPSTSSHTKDVKNGSGSSLHGTYDGGTTKHNWSAQCQYNVTGWVSILAYDMLSQ